MRIRPYIAIARVDHWFKNVFVLPGVVLALFDTPALASFALLVPFATALASVCLVASGNYVINEVLDAPSDLLHPEKRKRPVPSGLVNIPLAYAWSFSLYAAGLVLGFATNTGVGWTALVLGVMGVIYNVKPLRSKDVPIVDVLSESVNNPLRLLIGWFAVAPGGPPPLSIILAYWMVGAYFMAIKRLAEYRHLGNKDVAAAYRKSFKWYNADRLLVSIMFYATAFGLFGGIFMVRYHVELVLTVPFIAVFMATYLQTGLRPDSPTQRPEELYREKPLMLATLVCSLAVVAALTAHIPAIGHFFAPHMHAEIPATR